VFGQVGGSKPDAYVGHGSAKLSRWLLENGQPIIPIAEHLNVEAAEVESSGYLEFLVSHLVLVISKALRAGSMESVKRLGPPLCLPCESAVHSLQVCPVAYSPLPRLSTAFSTRSRVCLMRPHLDSLEELGYLGVGDWSCILSRCWSILMFEV
jgi:hypothetical protein